MSKLLLFLMLSGVLAASPRDRFWESASLDRNQLCNHRNYSTLDEDSLHQFDVLKITADLTFNLVNPSLSGEATVEIVANELPLDVVDFRLHHSLTLHAIWCETQTISSYDFLNSDSIRIHLDPAMNLGDTAAFHFAYEGLPDVIDSWGGMKFYPANAWRPEIAFVLGDGLNLSPPTATYTWLPCHLDPVDKLKFECFVTVDESLTVAGNGTRMSVVNNGDSTATWHYNLDQPVSTYLLFLSVSKYNILTQRDSLPQIEHFVYPSRVTQAEVNFANVPQILDGFVNLFGAYPFDKFGYNMVREGDMEHATCVSHLDAAVQSNHAYDWLLSHELAHQWWGDWVTIGDWRDMWLNEGFATYCQALSEEILNGNDAYHDYVATDLMPSARQAPNYTIYDPNYFWGSVVYEKGACVLHMLRFVLGDSLFFETLRDYGQQHAYASAVTTDFQAVCEQHYGESLQWFFDQWVYEGTGFPRLELVQGIDFDVYFYTIRQTQNGNYFRMPLEFQYRPQGGDWVLDTLWILPDGTEQWIPPDEHNISYADTVVLDPNGWLLKTVTRIILNADRNEATTPLSFELTAIYPNPFNPIATLNFTLDKPMDTSLRVMDILGRVVHHENLGFMSAGNHAIDWDGSQFSSGIYFFTISTEKLSQSAKAVLLK